MGLFYSLLLIGRFLHGVGIAAPAILSFLIIPSTILYPLCLNFMPKAKGRVSAVIVGSRLILSALSLQLAGFVYKGSFQYIGIIILPFILLSAVTLFKVINNDEIMKFRDKK